MLLNASGHVLTTVVDGNSFTGLYAEDGSINVFDATDITTHVGVYHPCGAYNVVGIEGSDHVGTYAPNGALNVVNDSGLFGMYHPTGALNVSGFETSLEGPGGPVQLYWFLNTWRDNP